MKKRLLALLLAVVMCMSLLPTAALADGVGDEDEYQELYYYFGEEISDDDENLVGVREVDEDKYNGTNLKPGNTSNYMLFYIQDNGGSFTNVAYDENSFSCSDGVSVQLSSEVDGAGVSYTGLNDSDLTNYFVNISLADNAEWNTDYYIIYTDADGIQYRMTVTSSLGALELFTESSFDTEYVLTNDVTIAEGDLTDGVYTLYAILEEGLAIESYELNGWSDWYSAEQLDDRTIQITIAQADLIERGGSIHVGLEVTAEDSNGDERYESVYHWVNWGGYYFGFSFLQWDDESEGYYFDVDKGGIGSSFNVWPTDKLAVVFFLYEVTDDGIEIIEAVNQTNLEVDGGSGLTFETVTDIAYGEEYDKDYVYVSANGWDEDYVVSYTSDVMIYTMTVDSTLGGVELFTQPTYDVEYLVIRSYADDGIINTDEEVTLYVVAREDLVIDSVELDYDYDGGVTVTGPTNGICTVTISTEAFANNDYNDLWVWLNATVYSSDDEEKNSWESGCGYGLHWCGLRVGHSWIQWDTYDQVYFDQDEGGIGGSLNGVYPTSENYLVFVLYKDNADGTTTVIQKIPVADIITSSGLNVYAYDGDYQDSEDAGIFAVVTVDDWNQEYTLSYTYLGTTYTLTIESSLNDGEWYAEPEATVANCLAADGAYTATGAGATVYFGGSRTMEDDGYEIVGVELIYNEDYVTIDWNAGTGFATITLTNKAIAEGFEGNVGVNVTFEDKNGGSWDWDSYYYFYPYRQILYSATALEDTEALYNDGILYADVESQLSSELTISVGTDVTAYLYRLYYDGEDWRISYGGPAACEDSGLTVTQDEEDDFLYTLTASSVGTYEVETGTNAYHLVVGGTELTDAQRWAWLENYVADNWDGYELLTLYSAVRTDDNGDSCIVLVIVDTNLYPTEDEQWQAWYNEQTIDWWVHLDELAKEGVAVEEYFYYFDDIPLTVIVAEGETGGATTEHTITVSTISNGIISVDKTTAAADETVTITVTPDTGYGISELVVRDEDGKKLDLVFNGDDNTYSFAMPDSAVTITATMFAIKVEVTEGIPSVPVGLGELYDSPDEIEADLLAYVAENISNSDVTAIYDVSVVMYVNGKWVEITEEYLKEYGYITVVIPYPTGTDSSYTFFAYHMFTCDMNGYEAGYIEDCAASNTVDGLQITLHGLSPVAVTGIAPGATRPSYNYDYDYEDISYRITTSATTHGTVSVSDTRAYEGDRITITVTPDDGYELSSLNVTTSSGKEVKLTQKSDTKYTFTMPSSKVTISATFVKVEEETEVLGTLTTVVPSTPFTDISTSRFKNAIAYVYDAGLMTGVSETTFEPEGTLTRGMIVTVLYRLAGGPEVSGSSIFADVDDGLWYTDAIIWATEQGIVNGYGNGNFGPDDDVTREQLAAIFYRYCSANGIYVGNTFALDGFTDNANVSSYAVTAMEWAVANSVLVSRTTAMLNPTDAATRAEVAQPLYILIK